MCSELLALWSVRERFRQTSGWQKGKDQIMTLTTANTEAFHTLIELGLKLYELHNPPPRLHASGCEVCDLLRRGQKAQDLLNNELRHQSSETRK
jgi:hypothetical protein